MEGNRGTLIGAACDKHLARIVREAAPVHPVDVRLVELAAQRDDMQCDCGVPAQWQVRTSPGKSL